jgi:peptidoglycan/LPS O-acetylase OafA/YrhL
VSTESLATQTRHLAGIHALRGIAAIMVFLLHLHKVGQIPIPKSWGLIASHGGLGVQLFFVLSAFSLLYTNQKYVKSNDSRWISSYLAKRFFRIAPLFYVLLAIHCMLILFAFDGALSLERVILSILFIFNFVPKEVEGIVWASWSIGVEMVFYAFLPLIMVSVQSIRSAFVLLVVGVLVSYIFRRAIEADIGISPGYAHFAFMSQLGVFCGGVLGYWVFAKMNTSTDVIRRRFFWLAWLCGPMLAILLLSNMTGFLVTHGRPDIQF